MLLVAAILATLDDPFYDPPEHLAKYETPQQRRSYKRASSCATTIGDGKRSRSGGGERAPARLPSRCAATRVAP